MKNILKKSMGIFLALAMVVALLPALTLPAKAADIWTGDTATSFAGGDGSSGAPWQIATGAQLAYLASLTNVAGTNNTAGKYYTLTADIDLNNIAWTPIGSTNTGTQFLGTFDGAGHIVPNLKMTDVTGRGGLFGQISYDPNYATIKNLGVENVDIAGHATSSAYMGGLVGAISATATIQNCYTTGTITAGTSTSNRAGGLIGQTTFVNGGITNCYSTVNISSSAGYAGGLIASSSAALSNCYAAGAITGTASDLGGFFGRYVGGSTTNCYWNETLTATGIGTGSGGTGTPTGATSDTMKAPEFVTTLGASAWKADGVPNKNGGYPVLIGVGAGSSGDPAPAISSISTASGSTAGGTTVVITGTDLSSAITVRFGSTSAASFIVNSSAQITAVSPPHAPGVVDITVTSSGGTSMTGAADQFTYTAGGTSLSAGDIVILEFNGSGTDGFTFMPLVNLATGTVINFTDYGWNATSGAFHTAEEGNGSGGGNMITYTALSPVTAGTLVRQDTSGSGGNAFTENADFVAYNFNHNNYIYTLNSLSGHDGVLAFQGSAASPTFIWGYHTGQWGKGSYDDFYWSDVPTGLTDGANAVYFADNDAWTDKTVDDGYYSGPTTEADAATWRSRVSNSANWTTMATGTAPSLLYPSTYSVTAASAPTVTTQAVSGIGTTTATGNGNITALGSPNPTAYGVCWNTTGTPTTSDSKVDNGAASATGAFTASMTGLSANTTYYVRAYATNTAGTCYGTQVIFATSAALPTPGSEDFQDDTADFGVAIPRTIDDWYYSILYADGSVHANSDTSSSAPYIDIVTCNASTAIIPNASDTALLVGGSWETDKYFQAKPKDGGEFKLVSFRFESNTAEEYSNQFKVIGYLDGTAVPGAVQIFDTAVMTVNTVTLSGDAWNDLDEFRIVGMQGSAETCDPNFFLDDLTVSDPVLAPAPTVTGISPNSGPTAGGTSVIITGTNFGPMGSTVGVTIGGVAATGVTVVGTDTTIMATTPSGTAGVKDVAVTVSGVTGTGIGLFTYVDPPEIDISGNGVSITSGDSTPTDVDHTDFGSAAVSGGTVVRTFTVSNTGAGALTLGGTPTVAITGAGAADFSVTAAPSTSIAASGTTTFQITFDPLAAGLRTALVSIANNDSNESTYTFAIQGTGLSSDAGLSTVAGQTDLAPGGGGGASAVTPITWSVNVANDKSSVSVTDISVAAGASFNLYSDSGFSTEVTGPATIPLTSGGATPVYVKVTAQDTSTVLYYAVTVNRAGAMPVVTTSGGATAFTETAGGTSVPVAVDAALTVSDSDSAALASAMVSITANFSSGEDVLAFTNDSVTMGNIICSYDGATGVLLLTSSGATATLAEWQAALRAVTYTNTSHNPSTGTRTMTFAVSDGVLTSAGATKDVSVTAVNDAPVLTATGGTTAFTEGNNVMSTPVAVDAGITVSDADNTTLASATVSIAASFVSSEDVLAFTNTNPATFGNISASYNSATGVLTLTSSGGTATTAQWQAALRAVTYTNTSETPTTADRTVSFTISDGTASSSAAEKTVSVTAVNDTPFHMSLSAVSVTENTAVDTTVGTFAAADADYSAFTYALVSGPGDTDNDSFTITGDALVLAVSPDYETQSSYSILVCATDDGGASLNKVFTITVTDVNEAPTNITLSASSVAENQPINTAVGNLTTTDEDTGDTFTYTLVDAGSYPDNGSFHITGGTLYTSEVFDYSVKSSYSIRVRSTDSGGLYAEKTLTITITEVNVAPTGISITGTSVSENSAIGTAVGTLTTTDANIVDAFTYSLPAGFGDNADFSIDGDELKLGVSPDYEAKSSYSVKIKTTDAGGLFYEETFTITVTNVNEAPTVTSGATASIAENGTGTLYTAAGTDPDAGDSLAWSLGGTDAGWFDIDASTGDVTFKTAPDYENPKDAGGNNVYDVTVIATDGGSLTGTKNVAITVTDAGDAPTDIALSASSVAENQPINTAVGSFTTTDQDAGDTFAYTLVDTASFPDNAGFTITGSTLNTNAIFDYSVKSSYAIRVRSTDGGGLFTEKTLTITITEVNVAPTDISITGTSINENSAVGTVVGTLTTTDSNTVETFTYSLPVGFGDNADFTIDGDELKLGVSPDYETKSSYSVKIRTTDAGGLFYEETFTITVTNVNEAPSVTSGGTASFAENGTGTVYTAAGSDPDTGDSLAWSLGGTDAGWFDIDGTTGAVTFKAAPDFESPKDAGGNNVYDVTVIATDNGSLTGTKNVAITVTDAGDAPTDIALSASSVAENQPINTAVGSFTTTDQDAGDTFTYTLVDTASYPDNLSFAITGSTLYTNAVFDYTVKNSYSIRVRSTDGGGLNTEKTFTITVTSINGAPTDLTLSASSVAENSAVGTVVGTLSTTDPNAGDTFTYSLTTGFGDNADFTIDGDELKLGVSPNYETKSSYSVKIRTTDSRGLFYEETFNITVTDINETPVITSGAAVTVLEGRIDTIYTATGSDPDGDALTWAIAGADAAQFTMDSGTGALAFIDRPSYTKPGDSNGDNRYELTVLASDGSLTATKAVTVTVTPAAAGGGTPGGETPGGAIVTVGGVPYTAGEQQNTTNSQGQSVTTVTVDTNRLQNIIGGLSHGETVVIPIMTGADVAAGVLTVAALEMLRDNGTTLAVETGTWTYALNPYDMNLNALMREFGADALPADVTVTVSIASPTGAAAAAVAAAVQDGGYALVLPAVEFTITCSYGGRTVEVTGFDAYVDRTVAIPDGVDPNSITTAAVVGPGGTIRSVPTEIVFLDGQYYARIHSLTDSVYVLIRNQVSFADVTEHWAKDAINNMGSRLVVSGVGDNLFMPGRDITRAEFAAIIVRALGLEPGSGTSSFTDVKAGDWFAGYVETAAAFGLITGYDNGAFGPGDRITREQAMTILARAMRITGLKGTLAAGEADVLLSAFADGKNVSGYAADGMAACLKAGILTGRDGGRLAAGDNITRAEVAVIVERLLELSGLI